MRRCTVAGSCRFLSTLSLRRATGKRGTEKSQGGYFYPRSPCGERPGAEIQHPGQVLISIHALLAESDKATAQVLWPPVISIHALLAESDCQCNLHRCSSHHFYPRSPCGERPPWTRPPKRGICISIHALLAESDRRCP